MTQYTFLSWNVNGIRSIFKKGNFAFLKECGADFICLQETKASEDQLEDEIRVIDGYHSFFSSAEKKGYSGTAIYSREKPQRIITGLGSDPRFDNEGRILRADFSSFTLINVYWPNGNSSTEREEYKMAFYDAFLKYVINLRKEIPSLIICGDLNTAHQEIDLFDPESFKNSSGFLPEERKWIDSFLAAGFADSFRLFNTYPKNYTWWDMISSARERNAGWRLDYFFISENLVKTLKDASILHEIQGSDHCPVSITLDI